MNSKDVQSPLTEKYRKTILDSGIRVVSERMEGVRSVCVGVWISAGSRNESEDVNGISHLLEHMLFKGTNSRTAFEIATSIESLGGTLNAFTDREFTCFYAIVLDENLPEAIDVLADVIQNAVLDKKDLQNEKRIVFEEIRNLEDTPEDLVHDVFFQTVFGSHSLGFPILGSFKSVKEIKRSNLTEYQKKFYSSNNMIVAAAGSLYHDQIVDLVKNCFRPLHTECSPPNEPFDLGADHSRRIRSSINQTHICTGAPAFSYQDSRKFSLIVLNSILGAGMSSRLFQNLREKKGLAYSIYSFVDLWSDTGLFGIYTGTSPKNMRKALRLIEEEILALCDKKVRKDELERTKSQLTRSLILTLEDSSSRMNRLAKMEAYTQRYMVVEEVVSQIKAVSQEDVRFVANELLDQQKRYTAILEPE